ncbi:hypothetical protein ACJX0J_029321, partial [Zea mays]
RPKEMKKTLKKWNLCVLGMQRSTDILSTCILYNLWFVPTRLEIKRGEKVAAFPLLFRVVLNFLSGFFFLLLQMTREGHLRNNGQEEHYSLTVLLLTSFLNCLGDQGLIPAMIHQ